MIPQEAAQGGAQSADDAGSEQDWTSEAGLTPDSTAHADLAFARYAIVLGISAISLFRMYLCESFYLAP